MDDVVITGTQRSELNGAAKLTNDEVIEMRKRRVHEFWTLEELADKYGITDKAVHLVVTGKQWAEVGGPLQSVKRGRTAASGKSTPKSDRLF